MTAYKKSMFMVCDTKSGRYCTDLDTNTSKQKQVSVHAKCSNKKKLSPFYLSFSTYQLYFYIYFADLVVASHSQDQSA